MRVTKISIGLGRNDGIGRRYVELSADLDGNETVERSAHDLEHDVRVLLGDVTENMLILDRFKDLAAETKKLGQKIEAQNARIKSNMAILEGHGKLAALAVRMKLDPVGLTKEAEGMSLEDEVPF